MFPLAVKSRDYSRRIQSPASRHLQSIHEAIACRNGLNHFLCRKQQLTHENILRSFPPCLRLTGAQHNASSTDLHDLHISLHFYHQRNLHFIQLLTVQDRRHRAHERSCSKLHSSHRSLESTKADDFRWQRMALIPVHKYRSRAIGMENVRNESNIDLSPSTHMIGDRGMFLVVQSGTDRRRVQSPAACSQ